MYFQDGVFVLKAPEIHPDNPENRKFPRKSHLNVEKRRLELEKKKREERDGKRGGKMDIVEEIDIEGGRGGRGAGS